MPFPAPMISGTAARAEQAGDIMNADRTVLTDAMWARTGNMPEGVRPRRHGGRPEGGLTGRTVAVVDAPGYPVRFAILPGA